MAVTSVPFDLVDAKLAAPVARRGAVAKSKAIEKLCGSRSPLVTVIAPAGYGKTTLLAQWGEADPRTFAWVALDGREDDPTVFLRYIAGAIDQVEPLSSELVGALSGPGRSTVWERVPPIGNALAAVGRPFVLTLDDLHTVANPVCLDAFAALVGYVPAGSQIAIASREEPTLPLARWRAEGAVHEIGAADLRLDEQEAEALLKDAGVELDASELSELTKRTEGWPAGLYLAALSSQAGTPIAASVAGFTGDDRFAADYFRLELLSRLPKAQAKFLKHTSVLDRMCGGVCDSVLETTHSAQTLEALRRTNCFLVPLDRRGEWYRYHHLFGELLRSELEYSDPGVVPELNSRAMAWCLANDLEEEAVSYGHAAGDMETVAGLIDRLALPVYYDGRMETLEAWLGWFGDDQLRRYPALAVLGAWVRVLTGRCDSAERWLDLADGAESSIALSDGSTTVAPWVANVRAVMMHNGVEQALADADRALDQLAPDSGWMPSALISRGTACALLGMSDRATRDLAAAVDRGRVLGAVDDTFVAQGQLSLLAAKRGAWDEAARQARAAQALVEATGLGDYAASGLAHVATARVALHEGRQDEARAALARAHRLRPLLDHGIPWLTIEVGLELTRAHLALAEPGAARTILAETERVLELRPHMGSLVEEASELREQVSATSGPAGSWAMSLTGAELRLLPYLATHLKFDEIADRLFVSRNTIKSQAVSAYRKLGASSRSDAIEHAVEVGLLEGSVIPPRANITPPA